MIRDRQLFGPGPSNPYPEATAALGLPLLGHLDPAFIELMDETCDMLRQAWGTTNARTLPISATGSAGMEAAFVNTVHPGDVVVVAVNGLFGQRMCDVAARCGAEVVPVEHEWGQPVDVERVLSAHDAPSVIAAVHAETSTGVRSDIAALGAAKGDALLVADAVTSIGGIELRADDWGIDVGYAGTQKCLGVAPGLAPFTINERAFERRASGLVAGPSRTDPSGLNRDPCSVLIAHATASPISSLRRWFSSRMVVKASMLWRYESTASARRSSSPASPGISARRALRIAARRSRRRYPRTLRPSCERASARTRPGRSANSRTPTLYASATSSSVPGYRWPISSSPIQCPAASSSSSRVG